MLFQGRYSSLVIGLTFYYFQLSALNYLVDHFCDVLLCEDIDSTNDAIDIDLVIHTLNDPDCHKKGEVCSK